MVILKTYSDSNTEHVGVCSVKLRHNVARCRFSLVPGDGPALAGMPDIQLLGMLKIMCEVVEHQQVGKNLTHR